MILEKTYSKEWFESKSHELAKGDAKLLEKAVMALTLLEHLVLNKVDFIFKGGTALILLLPEPRRFSIDIDIIEKGKPKDFATTFDNIVKNSPFIRWKSDNERKTVPKAPVEHYKFFYKSVVDASFGEEPILLDILYEKHSYHELKHMPIQNKWLVTGSPVISAEVPSIESILGDKLTAFAPNTTGILYTKDKPAEIIKQLYDIGHLFDEAKNIEAVTKTFHAIAKNEIGYRELKVNSDDVLQDLFDTCVIISERDEKSKEFLHLQTGIKNLFNFIFIEKFRIESAIVCASKAAYISVMVRNNVKNAPERFNGPEEIKDWSITDKRYQKFDAFKRINPEAFFYWFKAIELSTKAVTPIVISASENDKGHDNLTTLTFIINGKEVVIDNVNIHEPLRAAVERALAKSGSSGRPIGDWIVRWNNNNLDISKKVAEFRFTKDAKIFLDLKSGEGG
ncbi:MAG: nucleotidyl transferase AbiEii/AbiGii toxin family protein [Bacteroidota bacterium]